MAGSEESLEELVRGFIEVWDSLDTCLDNENKSNVLRYLPHGRYLLDVALEGLALHRGTVVSSLLKALPEFVRPMFLPGLTNVRTSVSHVTYVGKCRELLELVLTYSVRLGSRSRTRARVGITRIVALLSRLMVSERVISLDYHTVKALLTELRLLVLTGGVP